MNADVFVQNTGYYFEQTLKLIIYSYEQIKKEKSKVPYSRKKIHKAVKKIQRSDKAKNPIEDFLRNDMVNHYLKDLRHQFDLTIFSIQPGLEVSKQNVNIGVVDIRFECTSATSLDGTAFIFECKRLSKYSQYLNGYINEGMMRFVNRQYYAESEVTIAGMIAFVEVDTDKHPKGLLSLDRLALLLGNEIKSNKKTLKTREEFSNYPLSDENFKEIANFAFSYKSKHKRKGNNVIDIHHILLDYYDILTA